MADQQNDIELVAASRPHESLQGAAPQNQQSSTSDSVPEEHSISTDNTAVSQSQNLDVPTQSSAVSPDLESDHANKDKHEWVSKWLQAWAILIAAAMTISLIGAVMVLCIISVQKHGIASTTSNSAIVFSFDVGISLLWTFLPVLGFQIYGLGIAGIVTAAAVRQPYVELREQPKGRQVEGGAAAETSVLLDYQGYWSPLAPFMALKYNHYMLCYSFTVTLLVSLVLISLAAHLFFATTVQFLSDVNLDRTHAFVSDAFTTNLSVPLASMTPVNGIVSSTLIYGGQSIPWTTLSEAFLPCSIPESSSTRNHSFFTIPTKAYSTELDCQVLGYGEFELLEASNKHWYYTINDRGCKVKNVEFSPELSALYTDFVYLQSTISCPAQADYTRVYLVVASKIRGDTSTLHNKTAVSCIPCYYETTGTLSFSIDSTTCAPVIKSFTAQDRRKMGADPLFGRAFAFELPQAQTYDNSATIMSNVFGSIILDYAKKLSSDYYSGEVLTKALSDSYRAAFAAAANIYLILPEVSDTITGTVHVEETRVVVVLAVAYTIIAILILVLIMLLCIYLHVKKYHSILYEEPRALVGIARILLNSDLLQRVSDLVQTSKWATKVIKTLENETKAAQPGWQLDRWYEPEHASVRQTLKARPFGYRLLFKKQQ